MHTESTSSTIELLIVDDHPLASSGIARLLKREPDLRINAICLSGAEAIEAAHKFNPPIIVLELFSAEASSPLLRAMLRAAPDTKVVIVTRHSSQLEAVRNAGASGFVTTAVAARHLASCIRHVFEGATWIEYTGQTRRTSAETDLT